LRSLNAINFGRFRRLAPFSCYRSRRIRHNQWFESGILKSAAGKLSSKPTLSVIIPAGFIVPLEQCTAFALANPGTAAVTVRVAIYSTEGVPAAEPFTIALGPGQEKAQFLFESLPNFDVFDGTIVLTSESGGPFLAMALSWIKGKLALLPVLEN
jgi:hypothetical protein